MIDIAEKLPSKEDFSSALDSIFQVVGTDVPGFDLVLVEVDVLISNEVQENYSLLFRAPIDVPPLQNVYRLEHESLGKMDLFMVPVKQDEDGTYFEAIINLLI